MEKRIPVTNNTKMNLHVGSNIVPPGETRDFPESQVPHHLRPAPVEEEKVEDTKDPLAELLKGNVASVIAELPNMPDADVERLGALEQTGQARKTLLAAIGEMLLNRAANTDLLAKVAALSDAELAAVLEEVSTDINADPDYVAALEFEAAKRNPERVE